MTELMLSEIPSAAGIDPIDVFWKDIGPSQGSVTITCYGCAWTAYFGAMNERTIQEFFMQADTDYLVIKLGITPLLKGRKRDHIYLSRIVEHIKAWITKSLSSEGDADLDALKHNPEYFENWDKESK